MAFFGNLPTPRHGPNRGPGGAVAPAAALSRTPNAKLEGFRKTAIRYRAAPSLTYVVGADPAFKALVKLFSKMSAA